ncbi:MAG TPA: hypothetical protein VGF74_01055 [Thermoleophilaceae bacterium]
MHARARALAVLVVALFVFGATAATAKAPATGKFKASGGVAFTFTIHKGKCVPPPKNLNNPMAGHGPARKGLCFNSGDDPPVNITCPQGASISGETALVSSFSRLRLSKSGSMHLRAYAYTSAPDPVGFTELSIKVSGSKATGFVRETDQVFVNDQPVECDTGKLKFTARKS